MKEKIIVSLTIFFLSLVIVLVCVSILFYNPTCESCFKNCEKKHMMSIDDSWKICEIECIEKYGLEKCKYELTK